VISFEYSLSPVLAALLLKEFPPSYVEELALDGTFDRVRDRGAMDSFLNGLEEHRLVLRCHSDDNSFFDAALAYLEALLDPAPDPLSCSGIEATASAATTTWENMPADARQVLTLEATKLHPIVVALEHARTKKS
jgi:hypothetical protein